MKNMTELQNYNLICNYAVLSIPNIIRTKVCTFRYLDFLLYDANMAQLIQFKLRTLVDNNVG